MKNPALSASMKRVWKQRRTGRLIGRIVEQKRYTIKTTIVGNSKKELLAKIQLLAKQVRRDVK